MHDSVWFIDLGIILLVAFAVSLLFHRCKIPILFGYILSGLLLGPNLFPQWSPIQNAASIQSLSELGVIFLMFYVGLEFNPEKLKLIFRPALTVVVAQTLLFLFLGSQMAPFLGWSSMDGLFLGGLLAISSTMVAVTVLQDQNHLNRPYAQLAIGILIFEDIIAILLLVMLSGVAATGQLDPWQLLRIVSVVSIFIIFVYVVGRVFMPRILAALHKIGKMELITLFALACVCTFTILAEQFHFSAALGAFLAGATLAQNPLTHKIEKSIEPLRDLFSAIFFVSIGMTVNPSALYQYAIPIVLLSAGKLSLNIIITWAGLYFSGQKPDTSLRTALVKSQIGEFSFVIAGLGLSLGVVDPGIMSIAVGVAMITMLATPYLSTHADAIYTQLNQKIPSSWKLFGSFSQTIGRRIEVSSKPALWVLLKKPITQILIYSVLLFGILFISSLAADYTQNHVAIHSGITQTGIWGSAGILCITLIIAFVRNLNAIILIITESVLASYGTGRILQGKILNLFTHLILIIVLLLVGGAFFAASASYWPTGLSLIGFLGLLIALGVLFKKQWVRINSSLEAMFMESFQDESVDIEHRQHLEHTKHIAQNYPWPIQIAEITIPQESTAAGKTIAELNLRQQTGGSIIGLRRDHIIVYDLNPHTPIFPQDHLIAAGDKQQIDKLRHTLSDTSSPPQKPIHSPQLCLYRFIPDTHSPLIGNTLAGADLRRRYRINILGIQRQDQHLFSPQPSEIILATDILYGLGKTEDIEKLGCIIVDQQNTQS